MPTVFTTWTLQQVHSATRGDHMAYMCPGPKASSNRVLERLKKFADLLCEAAARTIDLRMMLDCTY